MVRYVVRRLLGSILVLIAGLTLIFVLTRVVPTDPARMVLGIDADPETVERFRKDAGLDGPIFEQYGLYVAQLLSGDLGTSLQTRKPVVEDLLQFYPATLELAMVAIVGIVVLGVVLGSVSGMTRNNRIDRLVRFTSLGSYAIAPFWLGLVLQVVFYANLGVLPATGRIGLGVDPPTQITGLYLVDSLLTLNGEAFVSSATHILLPALTLILGQTGLLVRIMRVSILDVKHRLYVTTAQAKGLHPRHVFRGHILRNAMLPVLTMAGIQLGWLLTGTVVVETIFGWPGLGRYAVNAIQYFDYAPLMAVALTAMVTFLVVNLIVDLLYGVADPRIRYD